MSTKSVPVTARQQFVCTAQTIADEINTYVQADAADGFVFALHLTPGGFDEFVEKMSRFFRTKACFETTILGKH